MTKSLKKRLDRAIAVVMAVAMLVGTLPADLLGGIASVKAAEVGPEWVVKTTGDWTVDGSNLKRTTTWDFTGNPDDTTSVGVEVGSTVKDLYVEAGSVSLKKKEKGYSSFSLKSFKTGSNESGSILIPLDDATTNVELSVALTSLTSSDSRFLVLGEGVTHKVFQSSSDASKTDADGAFSKAFTDYVNTFDMTDKNILLKYYHTLEVSEFCYKIASLLGMNDEEKNLAKLIGYLHDTGRFEQVAKTKTFPLLKLSILMSITSNPHFFNNFSIENLEKTFLTLTLAQRGLFETLEYILSKS